MNGADIIMMGVKNDEVYVLVSDYPKLQFYSAMENALQGWFCMY